MTNPTTKILLALLTLALLTDAASAQPLSHNANVEARARSTQGDLQFARQCRRSDGDSGNRPPHKAREVIS